MEIVREKTTQEENNELRKRILAINEEIGKDYVNIICQAHPEYNNKKGRRLIQSVKVCVVFDRTVTKYLEEYIAEKRKMIENLKPAINE